MIRREGRDAGGAVERRARPSRGEQADRARRPGSGRPVALAAVELDDGVDGSVVHQASPTEVSRTAPVAAGALRAAAARCLRRPRRDRRLLGGDRPRFSIDEGLGNAGVALWALARAGCRGAPGSVPRGRGRSDLAPGRRGLAGRPRATDAGTRHRGRPATARRARALLRVWLEHDRRTGQRPRG